MLRPTYPEPPVWPPPAGHGIRVKSRSNRRGRDDAARLISTGSKRQEGINAIESIIADSIYGDDPRGVRTHESPKRDHRRVESPARGHYEEHDRYSRDRRRGNEKHRGRQIARGNERLSSLSSYTSTSSQWDTGSSSYTVTSGSCSRSRSGYSGSILSTSSSRSVCCRKKAKGRVAIREESLTSYSSSSSYSSYTGTSASTMRAESGRHSRLYHEPHHQKVRSAGVGPRPLTYRRPAHREFRRTSATGDLVVPAVQYENSSSTATRVVKQASELVRMSPQMYERNVSGGQMAFSRANPVNPKVCATTPAASRPPSIIGGTTPGYSLTASQAVSDARRLIPQPAGYRSNASVSAEDPFVQRRTPIPGELDFDENPNSTFDVSAQLSQSNGGYGDEVKFESYIQRPKKNALCCA